MPNKSLEQQIASDPRVIALAQSRKHGNFPGVVSGRELQQFGYDVQNDVSYTTNMNPRNTRHDTPGVVEETTKSDRIIGGAAAGLGGYAALSGALAPAASMASSGGSVAAPSVNGITTSLPGAVASQAASATVPAAGAGLATAAAPSLLSRILKPENALDLARLVPSLVDMFRNNTDGPFGNGHEAEGLMGDIRKSIASQQQRFDATQPAFDTAQRMAIGMAPTRYRSGPFGG